jgi:hypothetical protein
VLQLLFATLPLGNLDHLPAVVPPAARANVMWPPELAAIAALDEMDGGDEDVTPPVALPMPADSLFRKRSHD